MNHIANKMIVITGASRGLGEATARLLAKRAFACVVSQPEDVDINEVPFRPTVQQSDRRQTS
jgi:NADP-dependent 3-hydroxy acid dehydrogenase YdfG